MRVGGHCWARIPGRDTKRAPGPIPAPPPTKGLAAFAERARRLPRPEARGSSLTCGRRSRMPAAWMSSQPTTRRSVSVSVSRPLDMDGVKRSLSSGRRQFSRVMSTPEYSRSPISTPCEPGAVPPEPGVPAATAGAVDPEAPAPAAAAILCRRLPFWLLPGRAAPRDALRPRPPRPAACHWFDWRAVRGSLAPIGCSACPSAARQAPELGAGGGTGSLPSRPCGALEIPSSRSRPGSSNRRGQLPATFRV